MTANFTPSGGLQARVCGVGGGAVYMCARVGYPGWTPDLSARGRLAGGKRPSGGDRALASCRQSSCIIYRFPSLPRALRLWILNISRLHQLHYYQGFCLRIPPQDGLSKFTARIRPGSQSSPPTDTGVALPVLTSKGTAARERRDTSPVDAGRPTAAQHVAREERLKRAADLSLLPVSTVTAGDGRWETCQQQQDKSGNTESLNFYFKNNNLKKSSRDQTVLILTPPPVKS